MFVSLFDESGEAEDVVDATKAWPEPRLILRLCCVELRVDALEENFAEQTVKDRGDADGSIVFWELLVPLLKKHRDLRPLPVPGHLVTAL